MDYQQQLNFIINQVRTLLQLTDWTQLPDVDLTTEEKANWATYRAALRGLKNQAGYPFVALPVAPYPIEPVPPQE